MKIFLSHRSRDKPLVRQFADALPAFLTTWLDADQLCWADRLSATLQTTIQSQVDFVILFLDRETLTSEWVHSELIWSLERERTLGRTFLLPIVLPDAEDGDLPQAISERLYLRLADFTEPAIHLLAGRATEKLFQLVLTSYAQQPATPVPALSLQQRQDELSAGQARLLGFVVQETSAGDEVTQRRIEEAMGHQRTSAELYYRLETLIYQGFLTKRRIPLDGMFSYRLSDDFRALVRPR